MTENMKAIIVSLAVLASVSCGLAISMEDRIELGDEGMARLRASQSAPSDSKFMTAITVGGDRFRVQVPAFMQSGSQFRIQLSDGHWETVRVY
jgi:hypothetical protein